MEKEKIICSYCGEEITGDYQEINGEIICQNCIDEHFYTCDCCGELVHEDEYYYFNDEIYCQNCYDENVTTCDCCGCEILRNTANYTSNDEIVCDDCYNDNYFTCDNCGEVYHIDYLNEHDGYYYCDDCYEEIEKNSEFDYYNATNREPLTIDKPLKEYCNCNAVCEYHDNPIDFIKRSCENEQTNLYFGVELEITNRENKTAQASHFVANNLYCRIEHDSSIPYNGFEIISDPMTFDFWNYRKPKTKQVFEELTNNDYISHNAGGDCGLHIHASREGLGNTNEEQEKTIENIILICENFKEELMAFSRRDNFRWCEFFKSNGEKETNIKKIKENKGNKGRYQVINTTNSNTIEFRLNRGTLNINTFFASLQLFYNIIELAKGNDFIGKTWKYLVNMHNFNELITYNKEKGIKSYTRIKETSLFEENEHIKQDKKIQKLREKSLIIYNDLQEFRFDILKEVIKYEKIKNNEFYTYCINSKNRDNIADLFYELKAKLSDINHLIDNATKTYYNINNEQIKYYNFNKDDIETKKIKTLEALQNIKNYSVFKYLFKEEK